MAKLLLFIKVPIVENYFSWKRINLLTLQMKNLLECKAPKSVFTIKK